VCCIGSHSDRKITPFRIVSGLGFSQLHNYQREGNCINYAVWIVLHKQVITIWFPPKITARELLDEC
jgi:hypothetical protein